MKERHLERVRKYLSVREAGRYALASKVADQYRSGSRRGTLLAEAKAVLLRAQKGGA